MKQKKYRVAVLDDDKYLLKDTVDQLKDFMELEVIAYDNKSDSFIEKIIGNQIDFLILDIDLKDDSKSGIDVAKMLKLPVLFLSGKAKENLESIKDLELNNDSPVDFILKGSTSHFEKGIKKFIIQYELYVQSKSISLKIKNEGIVKIEISNIAVITTEKDHGSGSGNKVIYFRNRKAAEIVDVSFTVLESMGIKDNSFIRIHDSIIINLNHVKAFKDKIFTIQHLDFNNKEVLGNYSLPKEINPQLKKALKEAGYMA